jgi:pseudaminic acid synthase
MEKLHLNKENLKPMEARVIAEMSGNHNGELDRAFEIVKAAARAGVWAVKIQTYTADTITMNVDSPDFQISPDHELWGGRTLYNLYEEAFTPWNWHQPIFDMARSLGVVAFSTPFDETAVDFLESLDCPIYKIASLEIIDLPLIEMVASTGKPLIISTGTATLEEVSDAISAAKLGGAKDITALVCTSSYPAKAEDVHLSRMKIIQDSFGVKVGLSDHTLGSAVAVAASALGASVIEKHVTLSRADGGVDSGFSMEPAELAQMILDINEAKAAVGEPNVWRTDAEQESVRLRPSLRFELDLPEGTVLKASDFRSVRPSGGLPPRDTSAVIGKVLTEAVSRGQALNWNQLSMESIRIRDIDSETST